MGNASKYAESGVDEPREQTALRFMLKAFKKTHSIRSGVGSPVAETDHFGSLLRLTGDLALAIATDGVGTKLLVAQETRRYREIAQDLVANNVNDILCMGAEPIAIVDYIGLDAADEHFLTEFSEGLAEASMNAGVSVVGGEIAQIGEMLNPHHSTPKFDVVATAIGLCSFGADDLAWPAALDRRNVTPGNILIAVPSSGLHSNGFSLARRVLLSEGRLNYRDRIDALSGAMLGDELLTPTRIYVKSILPLLKQKLISGLANISGGGLLTVSRLNPDVSFEISMLPQPQPIFDFIKETGSLSNAEAYSTFNMGIGMVMAVAEKAVSTVVQQLTRHGESPLVVGRVIDSGLNGEVIIPPLGLVGRGHEFHSA